MKLIDFFKNASFVILMTIFSVSIGCIVYHHYDTVVFAPKEEATNKQSFISNNGTWVAKSSIEDKLTEGEAVRKFKADAVKRGKAHWIIDQNGESEFEWVSAPTNNIEALENAYMEDRKYIKETLGRIDKFYTLMDRTTIVPVAKSTIEEKPSRFGIEEAKMAKRYNYNVEEFIKSQIHLVMSKSIYAWDGSNKYTFTEVLQKEVDDSITQVFDGFETYNKIYK